VFPAPVVSFDYHDIVVAPDASWREGAQHKFEIEKERQLACYADFCDECADCETRAAEDDQPTDDKPRIFGSVEAWQDAAPRDGFVMHEQPEGGWIKARLGGAVYQLNYVNQTQQYVFDDGVVEARLSGWDHQVIDLRLRRTLDAEHRCDMGVYHALRYLRGGVLDPQRVNPVNVRQMSQTRYASGVPRC
jgi:hypothetical protein